MSDWTTPEKSIDGVTLTWASRVHGTPVDLGEVRTQFVVQYKVVAGVNDMWLLALELSLDGQVWTVYDATPYLCGFPAGGPPPGAGTWSTLVYANGIAAGRYARVSGDNRNTGSPVATAWIAAG